MKSIFKRHKSNCLDAQIQHINTTFSRSEAKQGNDGKSGHLSNLLINHFSGIDQNLESTFPVVGDIYIYAGHF